MQIDQGYTEVFGQRIWTKKIRPENFKGNSTIVFLHDALGSIELWKNYPEKIVKETGCQAFLYDRTGHGKSDQGSNNNSESFFDHEALVILPELLQKCNVTDPILYGHSDGGTIALIYASKIRVKALILEAAHVLVEEITKKSVLKTAMNADNIIPRLEKYHGTKAFNLFYGWKDLWSGTPMRNWNIEYLLSRIDSPALIIQGEEDEYGTIDQVKKIQSGIQESKVLIIPECGHNPHKEYPDSLVSSVKEFIQNYT